MNTTHLKLEFGFGTGMDKDGKTISLGVQSEALIKIRRRAVELFGGCTLMRTAGDWFDVQTGIRHSESGQCLIVYVEENNPGKNPMDLINCIKEELNQAAVAFCASKVKFQII